MAENDTAITAREVPVVIGVLVNDSDPDGDEVTLVAWRQGRNGEVTRNSDGTLTYTPNEGFDGSDSFTYTIDDGHGGQGTGTVSVTVIPNPGVVVDGMLYAMRTFIPTGLLDAAAWGVNDQGQIVGAGGSEEDGEMPFFLDVDGRLTVIQIPSTPGSAFGINNHGLVSGVFFMPVDHAELFAVGAVTHEDHEHDHEHEHDEKALFGRSFLWDANTQSLVDIYQIVGASATLGFKVNDVGQVVGQVEFPGSEDEEDGASEDEDHDHGDHEHEHHARVTRGFIRHVDGTTSTFTVPGSRHTRLGGINNRAQIVGGFTVADGSGRPLTAFLRNADGTFSAFNVPGDHGAPLPTQANDINDAGVIVGHFLVGEHDHEHDPEHAHEGEAATVLPFLRRPDGAIFRFNVPDALQAHFSDINNRNVISGFGIDAEGVRQALILTPVQPAPNTFFRDTSADGDAHEHDHVH